MERLLLVGAAMALFGAPLTTFAAPIVPDSCAQLVDAYLRSGWQSGSVADVTLQVQPVRPFTGAQPFETRARLTLDYPRYPEVPGHLDGSSADEVGVRVGMRGGELVVDVTVGNYPLRVQPDGCVGSSYLYGASDSALVTLTLASMRAPISASAPELELLAR